MSQEKVNAYKESKANRKAEIEKAKRKNKRGKAIGTLFTVVIPVVIAGLLVWTGITIFNNYKAAQPDYTKNEKVIYQYVTESADISDLVSGDGTVIINDDGQDTTGEAQTESGAESEADTSEASSEQESSESSAAAADTTE